MAKFARRVFLTASGVVGLVATAPPFAARAVGGPGATKQSVVDENPSPIADAGSLPVGSARYRVPAHAVFVSPSGSDSARGTKSAPMRTLAGAVGRVGHGGTIVLRAGTYNEGSDTQNKRYPMGVVIAKSVTIQNYPGEAVWFDGSRAVTGKWTKSGGRWHTAYQAVFNRSTTSVDQAADGWGLKTGAGGTWVDPSRPCACWPDMVFRDGVQLRQVASKSEVRAGTFWVEGASAGGAWFQGRRLWIGDDPAKHQIRYANKVKLATFAGTKNSSTLRGIGVRRYASYNAGFGVIYMQHANNLENVWFEDSAATFINLDRAPSTKHTKITVRRAGFNYIQTNKSDHITFDRMDLQHCNYAGFNVWGPAARVIAIAKCQYVTLKNSILAHNNSNGFWVDQTTNTPIVANCLFEENVNRPIDLETASDGVVANCKFIHNGSVSVFINDSDMTRIWNCTFTKNAWGVAGSGGPQGISTTKSVPIIQVGQSRRRYDVAQYSYCYDARLGKEYYLVPSHQWTINSFAVCNSVLADPGKHSYAYVICGNDNDSTRSRSRTWRNMHPKIDGNVYHWGSHRPRYPWAFGNGYGRRYSIWFSLKSFVAGTGLDKRSRFTGSYPLNADARLKNTSYHGNGLPLPGDIAKLVGQPAGRRHVGAFW